MSTKAMYRMFLFLILLLSGGGRIATFTMSDVYCNEISGTEIEARYSLKVDDCVNSRENIAYYNDATECQEEVAGSSFDRQSIVMNETKFGQYMIKVDPLQDYKASEIKLCSFARPHMRAFHFSWWSYHVAFLMWFSITPLLSEIQESLDLTKQQIWSSSIAAVTGTIVMRFLLGPCCDKYGPRIPMGIILLCSAIPTGLTGLVNSAAGLTTLRFFIGIGGATFVMAQYWMSTMFTKEWVGTANAIVGGWGNLGGGITQILMGSFLFPLFRSIYDDSEKAWRTICIFPASLGIVTAYCVIMCTDDSPKGNFSKLKKQNEMEHVDMLKSFRDGACNSNTWLLFVQYACCFGVEITMNNAAALYFKEEFGLNTEQAAATASIFGWMNLFARGCGGFLSDRANMRWGMRGRLLWQSFVLFFEGCFVLIFAFSTNLLSAVVVLVFFSIFVQAAEGSTYGIVPYVNPPITGSISGIVGAGGNVGAVAFGLCFRQMAAKSAFLVMGSLIILSSILSLLIFIHGHPGLLWRTASEEDGVESSECSSTPMKMTRGPSVASSHAETAQSDAWSEERLEMHEMTLVEEEVDEELVDEQDLTI